MKTANKLSTILIIAIVAVIGIGTYFKVAERHREKLLEASSKKIEEAARKCRLEKKCLEEQITLGELIDKGYLEKQIHPITKEFVGEDLIIECESFVCKTTLT